MSKTEDVRAAAGRQLNFDPLVDAAHIAVRNVGADITLTGTVPGYPQYLQAAAAAHRVSGVTGVHHHADRPCPHLARHDAVVGAAWMARGVFDVRDELHVTG